ncbi:MAG: hypothetical protein F4X08_05280 [Gemmatimonadetes bacterium]|nr:hypothetical protein [Gemmatimonadota bacterium]MYD25205.1 hypothetical protein [Gemmatimonadota bacterium]MYI98306.1 hypothetical protein [Gemmatimonadota bacterium]
MKDLGLLLLVLLVTFAAACGNDEDSPVSTTPDHGPFNDAPTTGNVVFVPSDVRSTNQWGTDDYELKAAAVRGDTLAVSVSYSGGCRTHRFTLVAAEVFKESDPVQLDVAIAHDADGDPCEAYPTEDYHFILDPIKARYKASYGTGPGTIVLGLDRTPDGPLVYTFD